MCNQDMKLKVASKRASLINTLYNIKAKIYNVVYVNTCTEYVRNELYSCAGYDILKGHIQRKNSKPQNFEKIKISIYKIDMQNVKSRREL